VTDSLLISRPYRPSIKATKQGDDVIIRTGRACVRLDAEELHRLYAYAADRPTIQRYPVNGPTMPLTGETTTPLVNTSTAACPFTEPPWLLTNSRMPSPNDKLPNPVSNHPGHVLTHPNRMRALALRLRCGLCGCALPRDRLVYRQWPTEDTGTAGVFLASGAAPQHLSCALYSCLACPWLRSTRSRGRRSDVQRGGTMVVRAFAARGVVFDNDGVLLDDPMVATDPDLAKKAEPGVTYGYIGHVGDLVWDDRQELLDAYQDAVTVDAEIIDMATKLFWDDSPEGAQRLADDACQDEMLLTELHEAAVPFAPDRRLALI
jgi:hypothetical protein